MLSRGLWAWWGASGCSSRTDRIHQAPRLAPSVPTINDGLPGGRLPSLRRLLEQRDRPLRILETHSGLSGLIAEHARGVPADGKGGNDGGEPREFDGMWSSSLTASAVKGKPDIETVDTTARLGLVQETLSVTTKPMIYDADTGGQPEIFRFTVRALEQLGVSACIIEDKTGLKQNSLFGTARKQQLEDVDAFCAKIQAGLSARRSADFMVIARIEALIAGAGMDEALARAAAYTHAGASGIMIHSKEKAPDEILEFCARYRAAHGDGAVPLVVVPSSYNSIYESQLRDAGVAVCIYANHMLRASYPAMLAVAESILVHQRSKEADTKVMPIKHIITLVDDVDAGPIVKNEPAAAAVGETNGAAHDAAAAAAAFKARGGQGQGGMDAAATVEPPPPSATKAAATKVDPKGLLEYLQRELGINCYLGVPDSCLATFCAEVEAAGNSDGGDGGGHPTLRHVITANEGCAVMTAVGHHLATGEVPLVYMQNSGLGNAVNPIVSAAHQEVYGVPIVMMVGWRGAPGTKDEPQHVVQGRQTPAMLDAMGVPHLTLPKGDAAAAETMAKAAAMARAGSQPVAVLVPPSTFAGAKNVAAMPPADETRPTREQALRAILESVGPSDAIVSTTGYTSRELFELRETLGQAHAADFLTVGSMGHALAIAQGIARAQPQRTVWCLDGDGAALMHLGLFASSAGLPNLRHVLLNNRVHDSVGGQPTAASQHQQAGGGGGGDGVDGNGGGVTVAAADGGESGGGGGGGGAAEFKFSAVAEAAGYRTHGVARTANDLRAAIARMEWHEWSAGSGAPASFVEVELALGTRDDLGRPTISTHACKEALMGHLRLRCGVDGDGVSRTSAVSAGDARDANGASDAHNARDTPTQPQLSSKTQPPPQPPQPPRVYVTETGDPLLLTPGPLTTSASVKRAMMHDYGSRDEKFIELTARVRNQILQLLTGETAASAASATKASASASAPASATTATPAAQATPATPAIHEAFTCVPLQGSGTFAVEAMLMQFMPRDMGVLPDLADAGLLVLANGAYGRRMAQICAQHRRKCTLVELPEEAPVDPDSVGRLLEEHPRASHVAVVHCETTTGVINDVRRIAAVVQAAGRRLLIDAMSTFGILPLDGSTPFDAVAASSNKGLQGAPGLAFVVARKAALEESRMNADSLVLDLHAQWKGFEANGQWRFTPPTHCMLALSRALEELAAEGGVAGRNARYTANCATLVRGMRAMGFKTLLADEVQAPVIVTFLMPPDAAFVFDDFYARLAARGFVIYPGKLAKQASFRVGCIGHMAPKDATQFLRAVGEVVTEMGVKLM